MRIMFVDCTFYLFKNTNDDEKEKEDERIDKCMIDKLISIFPYYMLGIKCSTPHFIFIIVLQRGWYPYV